MKKLTMGMGLAALMLLFLAACSDSQGDLPANPETNPAAADEAPVSEEERSDSQGKMMESDADEEGEEPVADAEEEGEIADSAQAPDEPPTGEEEAAPGKSIVVCLAESPPDLFLYGDDALAAFALRHAVSENLVTSVGYAYQAGGLEKLPSLADGDARRLKVKVDEGDRVVDVNGSVVSLRKGVTVTNSEGEAVEFTDEASDEGVEMEQLEVDFTLQPLVWSDGTPVSAVDSVFSFNVANDPHTAAGKAKTGYTQSYEAIDDLSVRWIGLPGFMDQTYFTNVWAPLPAHTLARYTGAELRALDEVTRLPLSSGPYVIKEWVDETTVILSANPNYYRADEGLPLIEALTIKFGDLEELLPEDAACDVIADGALGSHNLADFEAQGDLDGWQIFTSPGNVYEQIAMGVLPVTEYRESRPDWFGDVRVRQALALCTDRERMMDELSGGNGQILETLAPSSHPLAPDSLTAWSYDPAGGNALLDEAGYLDFAEDGRRQDVSSGVPMTLTLGTNSEDGLRRRITEIFQENMDACGIPVELYDRPAGTWFSSGPTGPLFGRKFDLAALAWLGHVNPDCSIFTTEKIPGPEEYDFGGWNAPNVSGWSDEAYDAACNSAVDALPGGDGYDKNMREALRIFNEQLPVLPLFTGYTAVAVRPGVENVSPDPTQPSILWNIAEWDLAE